MSTKDERLAGEVLALFGDSRKLPSGVRPRFESRQRLEAEFTLTPRQYGYRDWLFDIELRIGPGRLYIVRDIRDFLKRVDEGRTLSFTPQFEYDPAQHHFGAADDALIRELVRVVRREELYRHTNGITSFQLSRSRQNDRERVLPLDSASWPAARQLLTAAPAVELQHRRRTWRGFRISDEPLPLQFAVDRAPEEDGYLLLIEGMPELTIMESYSAVLHDGKLWQLPAADCARLAELKQLTEREGTGRLPFAPEQAEQLMERVVPGLMKLGAVRIAQAVSDRIVKTKLKARLYLDRVKDRLLASLEFQYGDIVVNPLAHTKTQSNRQGQGESRILLRDGDQEQRILELMESVPCTITDGGYIWPDEEEQFDFLHNVIPELENQLAVYATTAVKERLFVGSAPPRISVRLSERTDWMSFTFHMAGITEAEIRRVLQDLEMKRKYYKLPNGALMPLQTQAFAEIRHFLKGIGITSRDVQGAELRLPALRGLGLLDARDNGSSIHFDKSLRRFLDDLRNPDNLECPLPEPLAPVLRDYQKFGFQWMKTLAHYRFGGILADDMGLGKTVQSITFLASVLPEIRERKQPALIVCPASLVYNWLGELRKFAPDIAAVIAEGTKHERSAVLDEAAGSADVVITSYPLLRKDPELYAGQTFHTLILDEAQAFKNYATQTAQAVRQLAAAHRFALTGTPVENSLDDLWSIAEAVMPGLFPDRRTFAELPREAVAKRIRPFLLRRLKADVVRELPDKIESLQTSELLPEQKKLYAALLAELKAEALKHLRDNNFQRSRIRILAGLTRLRQVCCHPALFVEGYAGGSAKFEQLLEIVEECRGAGKRALIFSQFTGMLGMIARELGERGVPFFYLDGSTPAEERVASCARFNEGERELFLISLKAGGTGLNLTGADTVILYDLWWNPAAEQQAADRAHRIGQKQVVHVMRLVAQGTVEDKMIALQERKRSLIDEVVQPGETELSALTEQDIRELLALE
ncbi:DEAD/DEAH box helicase [Paenibacillus cymbidii]|uniref:DEAD/DEAH box helicase n=1 Tax=Paenibacillus cymbidii TaxID=1639034 RepID=UPI001F456F22|nr:DEAD/DEAH box helicase [Paenibacillus cymbidii]